MDSLGYFEPIADTAIAGDARAPVGSLERLAARHPVRRAFNAARREVNHAGGRAYRLLRIVDRAHRLFAADPAAYAALLRERRVEPQHRGTSGAAGYLPTLRLLLGATKSDQTKLRYAQALALADRDGADDVAAFVRRQGGVSAAARRWREGEAVSAGCTNTNVVDCVAELVKERPELGGRVEGAAPAAAPRGLVLMLGHVDGSGQTKVLQVLPEGRAMLQRLLARRLDKVAGSQALVAAQAHGLAVVDEQTQYGLPAMMSQAAQVLALLGLAEWTTSAQAADDPSWSDASANFDWRVLATLDPPPPVTQPAPPAHTAEAVDLAGQPGHDIGDDLLSFNY